MTLPRVPLDAANERQHRTVIATTVNELVKVRPPFDKTDAESQAGVTPLDYTYAPYNVLRYGADPTATDDSTYAFNLASSAVPDGGAIYIPAGDYLIDSACFLVRGKSNIRIGGDGEVSRIRVSGQTDGNAVKLDFHTTMAVDQCSFVTIENLCIESKGINYGNTDAYSGLAQGDPRTNAIINYGGSALLVARSDNVTVRNVTARRCGSVGVMYFSSCEAVVVEGCFANARSLGYAGFAADSWADQSVNTHRTYKFIDCRVSKEDATYAAKAGVLTEGDETTGYCLNVEVIGGIYEDIAIGSDAPLWGAAVGGQETNLTVTGMTAKNCYQGVRWEKRGGAADLEYLHVTGCNLIDNKVCGIYLKVSTATSGVRMSVTGTRIVTNSTSVWSASSEEAVKVSSGIACGGTLGSNAVQVVGCDISGSQHGIYSIEKSNFDLSGCHIQTLNGGVTLYGGGILQLTGSQVATSAASSIAVFMTTANKGATTSSNLAATIEANTLSAAADSTSDYAIQLAGNTALYTTIIVKNNVVPLGVISAVKGSATIYAFDEVTLNTTQRIILHGLSGPNTFANITIPKEFLPAYNYAVGSDGVSRAVIGQVNNVGGARGTVQVIMAGDVRAFYDYTANTRITVMQ
jgi:hypothetical protein